MRESGIPRDQIFVTTKLWNSDHGYENTLQAFHRSMQELGLEYGENFSLRRGKMMVVEDALEFFKVLKADVLRRLNMPMQELGLEYDEEGEGDGGSQWGVRGRGRGERLSLRVCVYSERG